MSKTIATYKPGEYLPNITRAFPKFKRDLPIVAQDFTYYMDIMHIGSISMENNDEKRRIDERKYKKKRKYGRRNEMVFHIKDRRTKGRFIREVDEEQLRTPDFVPLYSCALVIVEATTRKAWVYPMHGKHNVEVFENFKLFLDDINMKISRLISDTGREYAGIKKMLINYPDMFRYHQVNANQNFHTTLSRVDRFIRTLRGMLKEYYTLVEIPSWPDVIQDMVRYYNNTKHRSLFIDDDKGVKHFYTPNQVWKNPEVRRWIKIKDYLTKCQNYKYIEEMKPKERDQIVEVYYRILPAQMKNRNENGYISQYTAKVLDKIGNTFTIQLKKKSDLDLDREQKCTTNYNGPIIQVPARDLILKEKYRPYKSKYNLKNRILFEGILPPPPPPPAPPPPPPNSPFSSDDEDDDEPPPPPPPKRRKRKTADQSAAEEAAKYINRMNRRK